jgi:hypothetical protein
MVGARQQFACREQQDSQWRVRFEVRNVVDVALGRGHMVILVPERVGRFGLADDVAAGGGGQHNHQTDAGAQPWGYALYECRNATTEGALRFGCRLQNRSNVALGGCRAGAACLFRLGHFFLCLLYPWTLRKTRSARIRPPVFF